MLRIGNARTADGEHMRNGADAECLLQELLGNLSQRHTRSRLTCGRTFQHRTSVIKTVFCACRSGQHALGAGGTAGHCAPHERSHDQAGRAHHFSPLRPLGVGDFNGYRRADGLTKTHTGSIRTLSCSNFIRAPRPYPRRRRANAPTISSVVTWTPAGSPSIMRQAPHRATHLLSASATCRLLFFRIQLVDYLNGMWYMICLPSLLCGLAVSVEDIRSRRIPRTWVAAGCVVQIIVNLIYALYANTLFLALQALLLPRCRRRCNALLL